MPRINRANAVIGTGLVIGSLALLLNARSLPVVNPYGAANAAFWPSIILACLIICGVIYFFAHGTTAEHDEGGSYLRMFAVCAILIALPITSMWCGFLLSSLVAIFLLMYVLGERDVRYLAAVPLVSTLAIYLVFIEAMSLALPRGQGIFWDLSVLLY